ncbi:hypothetical protein HUO13_33805 [Saccharopolyspora erythraea]|uniref:hypothetical protein n=1 Tax=Saccharopolyspora erythraea TaxID=1836 RepID=UPI001BA76645|nr:hypothetical protein [Saccharopolyspora erythraea]QUH05091.1 hypothetical protein HUO13_33805 [Saccharopolyspora erythraea]
MGLIEKYTLASRQERITEAPDRVDTAKPGHAARFHGRFDSSEPPKRAPYRRWRLP